MSLLDRFKKKEEKTKSVKKTDKVKIEKSKPIIKNKSIDIYKIIKEPHITEKAGILADQGKYVFKVYPRTNKVEVRKAIEALYGVKVRKVHMSHSAPKKRRLGKHQGWRHGLKKGFKKAIVSLKKGEKIELLPR